MDKNYKLTVYTRLNCRKCMEICDILAEYNIEYIEKTINVNYSYKREFQKHGFTYVPCIVLDYLGKTVKLENVTVDKALVIVNELHSS